MGVRTSTMSADLLWQCVRNQSSFIHKRRCGANKVIFNSEPNNLTNRNRFKDSGIANAKAVGVEANDEKGCVLTLKNAKRQRQVKRNSSSTKFKQSFTKVASAIKKNTQGYRSDFTDAALARWYKVWK